MVKDMVKDDKELLLRGLDFVQEGITMIDAAGTVRYANDAACRIMGVEKEEILHQQVDRLAKNKPLLLDIIQTKKSVIDVEYYMNFKGKNIHLINSGYPIFSDDGDIIGAIDIFRGIQRTRKLANTIAGYQALYTFQHILGKSRAVNESIRLAKAFSHNDENVLMIGESGTGKELFAQAIHNESGRRLHPFVALNCANFPDELIDSELFGYEEGAFTGAAKGGKPGKFELAQGGTLFLDEIGEMPLHLQAKLLRVIETRCVHRLGGNKPIHTDVKIIAATNRNMEKMVEEGQFRQDLYYRLKVLCLDIPPLRQRERDVLILAEHYAASLGEKLRQEKVLLDERAQRILLNYRWPGNIRELQNILARAMFMATGTVIREDDLQKAGLGGIAEKGKKSSDLDRDRIYDVLQETEGNKKKAAEILGISRPTLYKLLRQHDPTV